MNDKCCPSATEVAAPETTFQPAMDLWKSDDAWMFEIDLPGVHRDHVAIEVHDGVLDLRAEARTGAEGRRVHAEFDPVVYRRRIRVGDEVDVERIHADLAHGVLTLRLPRAEAKKPRKVEVKTGG